MLSRTGQAVALMRADMIRPHTPAGDPDAQHHLCTGMTPTNISHPGILARTRFFDDQVLQAIAAGVRQVAICGAGYDDRALRFRTPGLHFFELDHPGTQADKLQRLHAMGADLRGVTLAAADFRDNDVAAVLERAGHDRARPTLFFCEGLLVYLDRTTGDTLLTGLASRAAAGSTLVVSLATHSPGVDSAHAVEIANARRANSVDEPWCTILPAEEHLAGFPACGWNVQQVVDAVTLEPDVPAGRTLFVTAAPLRPLTSW